MTTHFTHYMHLNRSAFDAYYHAEKTCELRKYDTKRQLIGIDDAIFFYPANGERFQTTRAKEIDLVLAGYVKSFQVGSCRSIATGSWREAGFASEQDALDYLQETYRSTDDAFMAIHLCNLECLVDGRTPEELKPWDELLARMLRLIDEDDLDVIMRELPKLATAADAARNALPSGFQLAGSCGFYVARVGEAAMLLHRYLVALGEHLVHDNDSAGDGSVSQARMLLSETGGKWFEALDHIVQDCVAEIENRCPDEDKAISYLESFICWQRAR